MDDGKRFLKCHASSDSILSVIARSQITCGLEKKHCANRIIVACSSSSSNDADSVDFADNYQTINNSPQSILFITIAIVTVVTTAAAATMAMAILSKIN